MTVSTNIEYIPICNLYLDKKNPRFGGNVDASNTQKRKLHLPFGYIIERSTTLFAITGLAWQLSPGSDAGIEETSRKTVQA